jgi:hypothetical protein
MLKTKESPFWLQFSCTWRRLIFRSVLLIFNVVNYLANLLIQLEPVYIPLCTVFGLLFGWSTTETFLGTVIGGVSGLALAILAYQPVRILSCVACWLSERAFASYMVAAGKWIAYTKEQALIACERSRALQEKKYQFAVFGDADPTSPNYDQSA